MIWPFRSQRTYNYNGVKFAMPATLLQLSPAIPVVTPKGKGMAVGWIDYSEEHHLMWIVIQDETGEVWTWQNPEVRGQSNPTLGRNHVDRPKEV